MGLIMFGILFSFIINDGWVLFFLGLKNLEHKTSRWVYSKSETMELALYAYAPPQSKISVGGPRPFLHYGGLAIES